MTGMADLENLRQVCEARYTITQQAFATLQAEERRLQDELSRLAEMAQHSDTLNDRPLQMRAIGADVLWHGWLGRARSDANIKLAQVLTAKEKHMDAVRKDYGKLLMVQKLLADAKTEARKKSSASALTRAIDMSMITPR